MAKLDFWLSIYSVLVYSKCRNQEKGPFENIQRDRDRKLLVDYVFYDLRPFSTRRLFSRAEATFSFVW